MRRPQSEDQRDRKKKQKSYRFSLATEKKLGHSYGTDWLKGDFMAQGEHRGFVVVVDDDPGMRDMVTEFLTGSGFQVLTFSSGHDAFTYFTSPTGEERWNLSDVDVVASDLNMPDMDGLELIARLKKRDPDLPVVLFTAFGTIETAVEATRRGCFDYVAKPFKLADLLVVIERAQTFRNLKRENDSLKRQVQNRNENYGIIGRSKAIREIFDLIPRVAKTSANVLITGESGTGKEVIARAIHEAGPRSQMPFVAINCAAIPATLLESELFGHAKGSFTGAVQNRKGLFEEAHGGTILLDEIGDLEMALQAKLLRVIQEKSVRAVGDNAKKPIDVRIICATHRDLKAQIKDNLFREDLYYRISVIPLSVPALRERRDDIPLLAHYFLQKFRSVNPTPAKQFSAEALQKLSSAPWSGNVRELENVIERIVVMASEETIEAEDIPLDYQQSTDDLFLRAADELPTLEELKKRYIALILQKTGGHKEKAAELLGINRRTLYRKEREFGFVAGVEEGSSFLN